MAIDIDDLLKPITAELPSGPDLIADGEFANLAQACDDARKPGVKANWSTLRDGVVEQLRKTKDLRLAVNLLRCLTRAEGLSGAADGLIFLTKLIDQFWDQKLHPYKEKADIPRGNVLAPLASTLPEAGVVHDLRAALLAPETRMGVVSVRDVLLAQGKVTAQSGEASRPLEQLSDILKHSQSEHKVAFDGPVRVLTALVDLGAALKRRLPSTTIDLAPLIDAMRPVAEFCLTLGGPALPAAFAPKAPEAAKQPEPSTGGIQNEQDVHRILEEVCVFLETKHPSHPAPLLIRRAQRLLNKKFLDIIEDLSPGSLEAIRGLGGLKKP